MSFIKPRKHEGCFVFFNSDPSKKVTKTKLDLLICITISKVPKLVYLNFSKINV